MFGFGAASKLPSDIEDFDPQAQTLWQRLKYPVRWLLIALLIAGAMTLIRRTDVLSYLSQDNIEKLLAPLGSAAPAAFIGFCILASLAMVVPYSLMCATGTILFGSAWGVLWSVFGGALGALAVFGMARLLGHRMPQPRRSPRWEQLNARIERDGLYFLLILRALSIMPFNLLNVTAAFTAVKFWHFVVANLIGLIPSAFVYGVGIKVLLDPTLPREQLIALVVVVALLVGIPVVYRQYRRQKVRQQQRHLIRQAFEQPFEPRS
jgi:uncharacterized membrane protein YdjX (TVP38/TMEM64 family)